MCTSECKKLYLLFIFESIVWAHLGCTLLYKAFAASIAISRVHDWDAKPSHPKADGPLPTYKLQLTVLAH